MPWTVELDVMGRVRTQMEPARPYLPSPTRLRINDHELQAEQEVCHVRHVLPLSLCARARHGYCD